MELDKWEGPWQSRSRSAAEVLSGREFWDLGTGCWSSDPAREELADRTGVGCDEGFGMSAFVKGGFAAFNGVDKETLDFVVVVEEEEGAVSRWSSVWAKTPRVIMKET